MRLKAQALTLLVTSPVLKLSGGLSMSHLSLHPGWLKGAYWEEPGIKTKCAFILKLYYISTLSCPGQRRMWE